MQVIQLILFSTITIVTAAAGGYCLVHSEESAGQTQAAGQEPKKVHANVSFEGPKEEPQMPRSEMGTLIARNHDEIDQLRRMGERDYFEFTIEEGKAQTVGNVTVELKSINAKKSLFTIDVKADDKGFERKNHSVNDPIFFYTTGIQSALELVVNKLTKNQASGYLSAPRTRHRTI